MRLLLGTSNKSKLEYMKTYFKEGEIEVFTPKDLNIEIEIEEYGITPLENARIKALAYYEESKTPVIAFDSGMYFIDLPRENEIQPGVHVRRVKGKSLSDDEMITYYSGLAKEMGGKIRCSYYNGYAIVLDKEHIYEYMDEDAAEAFSFYLVDTPHHYRKEGWPLDSISVEITSGKYYFDLTNEELETLNKEKAVKQEQCRRKLREFYYRSLGL
ncbi:MAG: nucleoside triphosphatase [Herbinix sp.]|nr:nucleoside triphosphatase [Herbinix sp.]